MKNRLIIIILLSINIAFSQYRTVILIDNQNDTISGLGKWVPSNSEVMPFKKDENSEEEDFSLKNIIEIVYDSINGQQHLYRKEPFVLLKKNKVKKINNDLLFGFLDSSPLFENYMTAQRENFNNQVVTFNSFFLSKSGDDKVYLYYSEIFGEKENNELGKRTLLYLFKDECKNIEKHVAEYEVNQYSVVFAIPMILGDCN